MRAALGIVAVLLALVVVGMLGRQQLGALRSSAPAPQGAASAPGSVRVQSEQVQQQYREALDSALQQARPMPDDAK